MRINLSIFRSCRCSDQTPAATAHRDVVAPISFRSFNLCEEYANAFRTESYNEFWARVMELTLMKRSSNSVQRSMDQDSATPALLPSYHLFVDSLLDPDQGTVAGVLEHVSAQNHVRATSHGLLVDYFSETANASLLCGHLLKDIEHVRLRCCSLRNAIDSNADVEQLEDMFKAINPFSSLSSSQKEFRTVQSASTILLRRLDSHRKKTRGKLRLLTSLRRALAIVLIAATASASVVGVFLAIHAIVALATLPWLTVILPEWHRAFSTRWHRRALARLDTAAKGMYILNRDLDTISRLVTRLHDEVEHMLATMRFWSERGNSGDHYRGESVRPAKEVVQQLRKNEDNFHQQLDELEEHLFLCFMTINKARNLVIEELLWS